MSKASYIADLLLNGQTVTRYKEAGNSMLPIIKSNQPVDLEPITDDTVLEVGTIVFCKVKGNYHTHLISKIKGTGKSTRYQIANNKGFVNGWIPKTKIFGKVIKIH